MWQNGIMNFKKKDVMFIDDKIRNGMPPTVTDETVQKVEEITQAIGYLTINEQWSEVSKTVLYEMFKDRLGYWKLCTCWVPNMLTVDHKQNRVAGVQIFLMHYKEQGDSFLTCVVTADDS